MEVCGSKRPKPAADGGTYFCLRAPEHEGRCEADTNEGDGPSQWDGWVPTVQERMQWLGFEAQTKAMEATDGITVTDVPMVELPTTEKVCPKCKCELAAIHGVTWCEQCAEPEET